MQEQEIQNAVQLVINNSLAEINKDFNQLEKIKGQLDDLRLATEQMQKGQMPFDEKIIKRYYGLSGRFYEIVNNLQAHVPSPDSIMDLFSNKN